jgi:hypothetical protein
VLCVPAATHAGKGKAPNVTPSAGFLTCHVASGFGFIFGSTRDLDCTYAPVSAKPQNYVGSISKYGIDIGYLSSAVMLWGVYAQSVAEGPGVLEGSYVGATGSAAIGVGGGMHILVGGSSNAISLQPLSIEGNQGLNIAAGVASMTLKYVPPGAKQ